MSIPFFVVPLLLAAFVISVAGFQTTLLQVDNTLVEKLTKTEILLRAIKRANQRVQQLNSIQTATNELQGSSEYVIHFSIGTPTLSPVIAVMDTATNLIWTQCQPCDACFRQSTPVFDPRTSSSYSTMKCSSKEQCKSNMVNSNCNGGYCTYNNTYGDNSHTRGPLATETFTFEGAGQVPGIVFGCGVSNRVSFHNASGVVGLGPRGLSLVSQMNASRFSYCLPKIGSRKTGVLAIGSKSPTPSANVKATPVIKNPSRLDYYYLSLQGITVGTKRLPVSSTTFEIQKDGSRGMIIDCGAAVSYLPKTAFDQIDKELTSQLGGLNKSDWTYYIGLELCYDIPFYNVSTFLNKFPVMVFHFQNGVDLRLTQENYLYSESGVACLAMFSVGSNSYSVLGNFQLQNTLVAHDLAKGTISFQPNYAKCSGN